uniref:RING-type domain-containing protein n=1 Tax=Opuntia streptacantha TaxID=393608 RepID=A0A7C8YEW2_OPUST
MMNTHTTSETEDESKLTKHEQEQVLKKLKKEIYNPTPAKVMLPRRVSLYYRDLNRDPNYAKEAAMDPRKNKTLDEEGKSCAVCLEDFEAREEVMLTPCNHMFHEECIVPWVKSHGQCPVCRSVFCERIKENGSGNGNRAVALPPGHGVFEDELLSLIQTVNEVFPWGA